MLARSQNGQEHTKQQSERTGQAEDMPRAIKETQEGGNQGRLGILG